MKFLERVFKIKERGSTLFNELMGGGVVFIGLIYILSTNGGILSDLEMNEQGVFFTTAFASCLACIFMGIYANFPIALSSGMGLNAFLVYTIGLALGFSWQECMVLLFISGIIYFIFALTPVLKKFINGIPLNLKYIISSGLGAFLCFVGLRGGGNGIIDTSTGIPTLASLSAPHIFIPLLGFILTILLMFLKRPHLLSKLAIPIGVVFCAILSVGVNYIFYNGKNDLLASFNGSWGLDINSIKEIFLFGAFNENGQNIKGVFVSVFTNPVSYLAIFSIFFSTIFDATATTVSVGADVGLIDKQGKLKGGEKIFISNGVGSLIAGPFGTSSIVPFAESSLGSAFGAKTGLASVTTGLLFLVSSLFYPIFSIFSSWSVSAPALIAIGGVIFTNNMKKIDLHDVRYAIVTFFTIIFMLLAYSISVGIGIGIILFVLINLITNKKEDNNVVLYSVVILFIVYFILNEVIKFM